MNVDSNETAQDGKSGNPTAKTKRTYQNHNAGEVLEFIDNEEIVVMVDGKRKRMRKAEIHFQQLFNKSIGGDLSAARLIARMAAKYFAPEAFGSSETNFIVKPDESDKQIMSTPKSSQLKKGRPANPKERATRSEQPVSVGYLFRKISVERVPTKLNGKRIKTSRWQLYLDQIYTMSLKKNDGAARLLHQLRMQFPGNAPPGNQITYIISEADERL